MKGAKKSTRPKKPRKQYAALPYRRGKTIQILLLSSRETGRWVLPKGWPMKGRKPRAAAAREALEEAGIVGKIGKASIGVYHYVKRMKNGTAQRCAVTVFPLKVKRQRKNWPEKGERIYRWFPINKAAEAVEEPELRDLIRNFNDFLGFLLLNRWLVAEGWALAYRQFSKDYVADENSARKARRGPWRGESTPPWEWRQSRR